MWSPSARLCLLLAAIMIASTAGFYNFADGKDLTRSRRAIDQVGSWLLKRYPGQAGPHLSHLPTGNEGDSTGEKGTQNESKQQGDDQVKDLETEKRYLDSVGSYLLRKRGPPYKGVSAIDPVGSYLLKRGE